MVFWSICHLKIILISTFHDCFSLQNHCNDCKNCRSEVISLSPSEGVDAVNVDGVSLLLQHSPEREIVIFYKIKTILMHDHCIIT